MKHKFKFNYCFLVVGIVIIACIGWLPSNQTAIAATDSWSTSLHDVARTAASSDTTVSTTNASVLTQKWVAATGGPIAASPTISGNTAYFGSWDGYEYAADATTGAIKWKTYLGITTGSPSCLPPSLGISSPATVSGNVVYVGGGDQYWYALDTTTGVINWKILTGSLTGSYDGHFNWSGPLIYNGFAYVGIASLGDCPLVQGQLLKINLTTHNIDNTLNIVPNGQVGGGIWTSPALDTTTNTIYTATGTENSPSQTYAQAFLAIDAGTLAIKDHWKLPESEAVLDSDFSTSTTLFNDSGNRPLVTSINKNGWAYTFVRTNLAAGPIWKQSIAVGGDCPTCGQSSVSSSAFGGGRVYYAGATGTIGNQGFPGTIRALDPATGAYIWQHPSSGAVIGALAYANGLVYAGAGHDLEVLDASTGKTVYSYDTGAEIYAGPSISGGMIYIGNVAGKVLAFGLGVPITPAPDPNCPSGFTCQNIGTGSPTGSESVTSGNWTMTTAGAGFSTSGDSLRVASQPASGDAQITAQVTNLPTNMPGVGGGIILRQNNQPNSPFYSVTLGAGNSLTIQNRTTFGGNVNTINTVTRPGLPLYLMLQRINNTLTAATSTDGVSYNLVPGTTTTMVMPASSLAGLVAYSGSSTSAGSFSFAHVAIGSPSLTPSPTPAASACPSGWNCGDVGNPYIVGDQTLANGTWTIKGSGGDIWSDSDQFHYVSQSINGDSTIGGRVTSLTNTDPSAKAGFMMRQSNAAGSAYYAAYIQPDNSIHVQYRDSNGYSAGETAKASATPPAYLQIARSGTTFTAYTSGDGTNWNPIPVSTRTIPSLSGTITAGLAISSHNTGTLASATLTNVQVTASAPLPPNLCPNSWTCADIGYPTPAGGQTLNGSTWSVQSGGGDIWGSYDTFRLISQNLNSDGSVSAHLSAQSNTGPWAKAGTMLRLSSDPAAPYYAAFATPSNGVVVQWRTAQGGSTQQIAISGTVPIYLKTARSGINFTAYTSTNGSNWTPITGSAQNIASMSGTLLAGIAADSTDTATINNTTWDNVNITGGGGPAGLPSPWTDGDIGAPTQAGSASYSNNTFTLKGGGNDIWGTTDQFNYASQPLTGDGQIIARVTGQTNTDSWAKAGIMIKQSTTSGSSYAAAIVTPGNGLHFQYNFNGDSGGAAYALPNVWLKLVRAGNLFNAYSSSDGTNWTALGQTQITMSSGATVGLFTTSHNGSALSTVAFDNVTVTPTGGGALPSPWVSGDIGTPLLPGSASNSNGVFTVKGSGDDIWGTADDFQFVSQPLSGDGQIVARVPSQDNTDPWAKSGLMIKNSLTAGSPYASVMVTPGNGLHSQSNFNSDVSGGTYSFPNAWLKLVRTGTKITTFSSPDGSNWTPIGTSTVALGQVAQIGMFVCAHNGSALNTTTFDNVAVSSSSALPTGWNNADIGSPAITGSGTFSNSTYSISGSGSDIWGSNDQFHFTYRSLAGDGQIIARVASQQATDSWAKTGLMIKQSTTSGSSYAAIFVTPSNGVHLQSNFTSDWTGSVASVPVWLKLVRSGNTVTAFQSSDNVAWTSVGPSINLALNNPAEIGMFVCAHNSGTIGTSTFDNVTTLP